MLSLPALTIYAVVPTAASAIRMAATRVALVFMRMTRLVMEMALVPVAAFAASCRILVETPAPLPVAVETTEDRRLGVNAAALASTVRKLLSAATPCAASQPPMVSG